MNKIITTLFLSFLCQFLYAQQQDLVKEMIGNDIQIRQKAHTEKLMTEWLKDLPVRNDTIYAILYVPMDCPRCEAAITNFQEMLKDVDKNQELILITAYPDSMLAKEYNQRNGYIADAYLYDTTEHYKKILRANMPGGLMGLHILKIDRKNGNLLTRYIDIIYDNFRGRLLGLAELSEVELRACCLIKVGLTPSAISSLLFKSKPAISMLRRRLYEKITHQKGSSEQLDEFIKNF